MANFLLVHGAFHGGWCYDRVRPLLEAQGHKVWTPTLTGVGERSHLASLGIVNLDTHVQDIVNFIRWRGLEDLVLCGHSYGGLVITAVADQLPDRVASLVYLDAMVPKDGDTAMSIVPTVLEILIARSAALGGGLIAPFTGAEFGLDAEDQAWADPLMTPHPLASLTQRVSLTGAYQGIAKRVFIYDATPTMASPFPDYYETQRGLPGNHVFSLPGGHELMVTNPAGVAKILLETL